MILHFVQSDKNKQIGDKNMKLNKGFTLAEVLIALGIVGVLAALTLPTLQANTQTKTIGTAVMKAVQQLENAHKMLLNENDAASLETVCGSAYPECLSKYLGLAKFQPASTDKYSKFGSKSGEYLYNTCTNAFTSDDGFVYFRDSSNGCGNPAAQSFSASNDNHISEKYNGYKYYLTVDINGIDTKPNEVARDVFRFLIDTNGAVMALGSGAYAKYTGSTGNYWMTKTCKSGYKPITTVYSSANAWYCVGSIVDNGGKVMYKF